MFTYCCWVFLVTSYVWLNIFLFYFEDLLFIIHIRVFSFEYVVITNYRTQIHQQGVLEPQVSPAFTITYFCNHCHIRFDPMSLLKWYVRIYPRIIMSKFHENTLLPFFKNFGQKVNNPKWPLHDLWPHICSCLMCDSTQRSLFPGNTSKYVNTGVIFTNLTKRWMTPRWPLMPLLLRSHVWLYRMITVSKSHENISKYVDTVTIFSKTLTKR